MRHLIPASRDVPCVRDLSRPMRSTVNGKLDGLTIADPPILTVLLSLLRTSCFFRSSLTSLFP